MPTEPEPRGNYLPEPPYLRETKTYHSQPVESIRHAGNYFAPLSTRPIFIFFVEVMSNYLTTDGLKIFSLLPEAPLRPVAFATWLIRHCLLVIWPVKKWHRRNDAWINVRWISCRKWVSVEMQRDKITKKYPVLSQPNAIVRCHVVSH